MKIGCSECLCIAIESHRSALLKWLLQRSDVQYRDIYWAPTPTRKSWKVIAGEEVRMFPLLHDMGSDMDFSIVGRDDCGHMRVDVELCAPFDFFEKERAYILVSLPMIARWHTSERFNAERILRQSGKFDYSEPQFFEVQFGIKNRNALPGPLNVLETYWSNTMCEYECRNESCSVSLDSSTKEISRYDPSTLPGNMVTVNVSINSGVYVNVSIGKFYGKLSRVFYTNQHKISTAGILERIQKILECGGDLNDFLLSRHGSYVWGNYDGFKWRAYRSSHCFDLIAKWRLLFEKALIFVHPRFPQLNYVKIRDAHQFTRFLLRNGLSFFYKSTIRNSEKHWQWESDNANISLLQPLFLHHSRMPEGFFRGIAQQLLALGYGRRELHPAPLPLHDERLDDTWRELQRFSKTFSNISNLAHELQSLVQHFHEGPLSLKRLSRIAVRRAVGGADFARQVGRLAGYIPPALVEYVADPTELMLSDEEIDRFVRSGE